MARLNYWDSTAEEWVPIAVSDPEVFVGATAPADPGQDGVWIDTSETSTADVLVTGTAFPASPVAGDRYRRSDIDYMVFFYDGTRWLSEQMLVLSHQTYLASVDGYAVWPVRSDYQMYLVDWDVLTYISTAATWVATLQTFDTEYDGFTTLDSVSTVAQTAAEFYRETRALDDVVDGTAAHAANVVRGIRVFWDEQSGSASFIGSAVIRYRLIAT